MTKCNKNLYYSINDTLLELRDNETNGWTSLCCPKCLPDLERAITKYKKSLEKKKKKK